MAILNTLSKDNRKVQIEKDNETYKVYAVTEPLEASEKATRALGDMDLRPLCKKLTPDERKQILVQRIENQLERATRVKKAREVMGVTQQALSVILGYTPGYIGNVESGGTTCPPRFIKTLSDASGVSEAYLKLESDSMFENGLVPLYIGNDVETATAISKLYLSSNLTADEFMQHTKALIESLNSLQLKTSLQAALA